MSVAVSTWAWEQAAASPGQKLVLVKLADSANDDGVCWPSLRTLERHLGMGKSSVQRHVKGLVEAGLLTVEVRKHTNKRRRSNLYRLAASTLSHSGGTTSEEVVPLRAGRPLSHSGRDIEPSLEPKEANASSAKPKKEKPRDPLFDVLAVACGLRLDAMTKEAGRLCGIATAEIRRTGATVEMIAPAVRNYRRRYEGAAATPKAIANHWPEIVPSSKGTAATCEECGIGGDLHLAECSKAAA